MHPEYIKVTQLLMSTYSFFQAHVQQTFLADTFVGHNTDNKVLPDCDTPANADVEEDLLTTEEKMNEVLSDPKFGMFSLFAYQVTTGSQNTILKKRNTVFCSHIFSLVLALPILVFITQWMMYIAIVRHQIRTYDRGFCPNSANIEEKMMMAAVAMFYFIKSFFLWDSIVDRTRRKKMISSTSYIVMMDTFQEFGFNLVIYITNLLLIFTEPDIFNMIFNSMAMEFLMQMDNEFEVNYFTFLPGVAEAIYDEQFVTREQNQTMVANKTRHSGCFRCFRRVTWIPYKLLILSFLLLPIFCFIMIFYGGFCK